MKKIVVVVALALLAGIAVPTLPAESLANTIQHSRTNSTFGASLTKGYDSPWSLEGVGALSRSFTFFDADSPDGGFYYGFGASLGGSAGGVAIVDTWLATLGWMGNPLSLLGRPAFDFDLNLSVSPTLGSRIQNRVIQGAGYVGLGGSLGLSVPFPLTIPLIGDGAVGFTWDPVVPLSRLFDSRDVANTGYMNFALTWTVKQHRETRTLPWQG